MVAFKNLLKTFQKIEESHNKTIKIYEEETNHPLSN